MISFSSVTIFALFPLVFAQLRIETPASVVTCEPTKLAWSGGTPPYFLSLLPGGQATAPPLKQFPPSNGTAMTWKTDLPAGTTITASIKDNTGSQAFSDIVTIQKGPDSSCTNTSIADSGTAGTAPPASGGDSSPATTSARSSPGSSGSPGPSSAKPAMSGTASSTASSTVSAAASSGTPKSNGASGTQGNTLAVVGVMGLVGAVLF